MSDNDTDGTERRTDSKTSVSRRGFLQASSAIAGASLLGLGGSDLAAAATDVDPAFYNWRAREAAHAWDRGYRGRTDRTVGLTDSGIEARHPDTGPWNGVRAVSRDGELKLTRDVGESVDRIELDEDESFAGTIGPGTFATPDVARHEFTAPERADEVQAALSWSVGDVNDLEFYVETADGERVARAATANQPETVTVEVDPGETYVFVVETYASLATDYQIQGDYYRYEGTLKTYEGSPFAGVDDVGPSTPKVVGWYDEGSRYGRHAEPRDPDGHGTHCTSIMAGSGRTSAVDPDRSDQEAPHATLALGESITREVSARADTGVYASAYGNAIEVRIEGPDGQELAASTIAGNDTSEWDGNVIDAPTVHDEGEATYAVHVTAYDGEIVTAATVDRLAYGAFRREDETTGDREDGRNALHSGMAPNQSLVGLQGLSGPTVALGKYADAFASTFNMRAVNMSWGYVGGAPLGAAGGTLDQLPGTLKDITEAGILVSAAAGNAATPANGNGIPGVADETISVVATGPLDGIAGYSSGGLAAYDEDTQTVYRKPDVTAPGGTLTDLARAAKAGDADAPEDEQPAIRDYTGKAGTSMASPYVTGTTGLVAQAMEEDAPASIALPHPDDTGFDDVMRLKQVLLATATETALTAAPYHRAKAPTYDFGARDPFEGYGRVNPGAAIDAVTRDAEGTTEGVVGLDLPDHERAIAGYVRAGPGTVDVSVSFSHYSGANAGAAEGAPHVDMFVYDAENPAENGEPNVLARAQGLQGSASTSVSFGRDSPERTLYVVAKLVNVPGVVNGFDVEAHLKLDVDVTEGFFASGTRQDDGSVFTGGQTNQVGLTVNPSEDSAFRDVVPAEWTVLTEYSDDVARVEDAGDVKYVHFDAEATADAETSVTYFAEAPDGYADSGEYVFGPAQVNPESREGWVDVAGTSDTNVVAGQST